MYATSYKRHFQVQDGKTRMSMIFQLCQVRDQCSISMWSQRMIEPKNTWGLVLSTVIIIDVTPLCKPYGKGDFDDKMWFEGNSGEVET